MLTGNDLYVFSSHTYEILDGVCGKTRFSIEDLSGMPSELLIQGRVLIC